MVQPTVHCGKFHLSFAQCLEDHSSKMKNAKNDAQETGALKSSFKRGFRSASAMAEANERWKNE